MGPGFGSHKTLSLNFMACSQAHGTSLVTLLMAETEVPLQILFLDNSIRFQGPSYYILLILHMS